MQLNRDPATRRTSASELSPPATGEAAIAWVEQEVEATGVWPLVISTDNGPPFKSEAFEDFLEEHQIVHLMNLPHTPEHNCHTERGVKELKGVLGIPRGRLAAAARGSVHEWLLAAT